MNNFISIRLKERLNSRQKVKNLLKKVIIHYHTNPEQMENYLKNEKFDKLEKYLSERLPTQDKFRKGDFGEIIGCEHLKGRHDFVFPVLRLRYKTRSDTSQTGEDILGFKIHDNKIIGICVGESKVGSKFNNKHIEDAHTQLTKSYNPHPHSLSFIEDRLYDQKNYDLSEKVGEISSNINNYQKSNWIFFISGTRPKDPPGSMLKKIEVDNLTIANFHLESLGTFINGLYDECKDLKHGERKHY
jgi:hypothetical protein